MSSLHEELTGSSAPACKLCAYLDGLAPSDAAAWAAELALPVRVIRNSAVVLAMRKRGVILTEASVRRHRGNHA